MAGSYEHLLHGPGSWRLIEHMGDAYECVEELWWLVERAIGEAEARRLIHEEFRPMERGEQELTAALLKVKEGMDPDAPWGIDEATD